MEGNDRLEMTGWRQLTFPLFILTFKVSYVFREMHINVS